MRSFIIGAACVAVILSDQRIAYSQNYYVVVGAFAANGKASEFKGFLPDQFTDTSYTISENDQMLHFYVLKTSDQESAMSKTLQLRKAIESLRDGESSPGSLRPEISIMSTPIRSTIDETSGEAMAPSSSASASSAAVGAANAGHIPPKPVGKYFKFNIESPDGRTLSAQVHHIDPQEGRELGAYKSDTFVDLLRPGESSEPMTVVCGLFGYKEMYKFIDYSDPSNTDGEAYVDDQGVWVIPYKLERVEEGDVSPMYNVSFYKDAAIMRKTSAVDLEELVRMMHRNPYYEITIHAHCNGRTKREIIAPGATRNYFDIDGSVKVKGTARDLTTLRAEAIRAYLMDHGVDPARIDIFPWGASDMLVKSDDPNADLNNRIEIEFTRD